LFQRLVDGVHSTNMYIHMLIKTMGVNWCI